MRGSFVNRDCLVNINEVSEALEFAQGDVDIVQMVRLVSVSFGSEMHGSFVSRACLVNGCNATEIYIATE